MGNYVIAGWGITNYVIANPSNLGNFMIADSQAAPLRPRSQFTRGQTKDIRRRARLAGLINEYQQVA